MASPFENRRRHYRRYHLFVQLGLIGALSVLLLAFKMEWSPQPERSVEAPPPIFEPLVEMPATVQKQKLPPPPRPLIPVVVPDETELEDIDILINPDDVLVLTLNAPPPPEPPRPPEPEENEPFYIVEQMPEVVGGLEALYKLVDYPPLARRAGVQGRVTVQFVVDEQGNVLDPVVLKSVHPLLDEAALAAIQQVRFTPGRQRGKAVKVKMSLPINFKLH